VLPPGFAPFAAFTSVEARAFPPWVAVEPPFFELWVVFYLATYEEFDFGLQASD